MRSAGSQRFKLLAGEKGGVGGCSMALLTGHVPRLFHSAGTEDGALKTARIPWLLACVRSPAMGEGSCRDGQETESCWRNGVDKALAGGGGRCELAISLAGGLRAVATEAPLFFVREESEDVVEEESTGVKERHRINSGEFVCAGVPMEADN